MSMRVVMIFICLVYILLVLSGVVQFHLWSQVEYMHSMESNLLSMVDSPHFSRYLLVLPIYVIADAVSLAPDYLFSIFCAGLIIGLVRVLIEVHSLIMKKNTFFSLLLLLLFIALSIFMNGRIIAALFAMSLALYVYACWNNKDETSVIKLLFIVAAALWFSSVSSGTFVIVYIIFTIIIFEMLGKFLLQGLRQDQMVSLAVLIGWIGLAAPLLVTFLDKNMTYFDGFLPMLQHGVGKVLLLLPLDAAIFSGAIICALSMFFVKAYFEVEFIRPLVVTFFIGVLGGGFGLSTLMMAIPPALLLLPLLFSWLRPTINRTEVQ